MILKEDSTEQKLRGAYYKMSTLSDEERSRGIITASATDAAFAFLPCAAAFLSAQSRSAYDTAQCNPNAIASPAAPNSATTRQIDVCTRSDPGKSECRCFSDRWRHVLELSSIIPSTLHFPSPPRNRAFPTLFSLPFPFDLAHSPPYASKNWNRFRVPP